MRETRVAGTEKEEDPRWRKEREREVNKDDDGVTPRVVADSRQLKAPRRVTSLSFVSSLVLSSHRCLSLHHTCGRQHTSACVQLETRTMFLLSPYPPRLVPRYPLPLCSPLLFSFAPPPLTHLQYHPFFFFLPRQPRPCPSLSRSLQRNTMHQLQPLADAHSTRSVNVLPCRVRVCAFRRFACRCEVRVVGGVGGRTRDTRLGGGERGSTREGMTSPRSFSYSTWLTRGNSSPRPLSWSDFARSASRRSLFANEFRRAFTVSERMRCLDEELLWIIGRSNLKFEARVISELDSFFRLVWGLLDSLGLVDEGGGKHRGLDRCGNNKSEVRPFGGTLFLVYRMVT